MNLMKLRKDALVAMCSSTGIDTSGTRAVLMDRLATTGDHWVLKYIKLKLKKSTPKVDYMTTVPKQVSRIKNFD